MFGQVWMVDCQKSATLTSTKGRRRLTSVSDTILTLLTSGRKQHWDARSAGAEDITEWRTGKKKVECGRKKRKKESWHHKSLGAGPSCPLCKVDWGVGDVNLWQVIWNEPGRFRTHTHTHAILTHICTRSCSGFHSHTQSQIWHASCSFSLPWLTPQKDTRNSNHQNI